MKIYILSGPYEGNNYNFDYDITIGRDSSNDIPLPLDLSISRKHLKISTVGKELIIEDLNSTNGTFLLENGKMIKVSGKKIINKFPIFLKIGNTVMEVEA